MSRGTFQKKLRQIKLSKCTILPVSFGPHININRYQEVPGTLNIQE